MAGGRLSIFSTRRCDKNHFSSATKPAIDATQSSSLGFSRILPFITCSSVEMQNVRFPWKLERYRDCLSALLHHLQVDISAKAPAYSPFRGSLTRVPLKV
ncbi:hypothetical protein NE237_010258 [Protea cynaroides]|uniref:Uncharacterized protein n=1 Tax=Protea cynaroides TaxID=273540 RepID=A0A9Q0KYZ6_9MAGN|nr:hypothetical protein NE237_010258 [Protea cynaroides]